MHHLFIFPLQIGTAGAGQDLMRGMAGFVKAARQRSGRAARLAPRLAP